jgi:hypothetical protein
MGTQSLLGDLEVEVKIKILEDSSAAKGIAERTGLGKVRHIEVNQLWIQEKVRDGKIQLVKVEGTENLADALTKYVDSDMLEKHIKGSECEVVEGRHELMPEVQSAETDPKEKTEAEVVAGYATEYSGTMLLMIFLVEYSHLVISSVHTVIFFLGGWYTLNYF